MASEQNGPAPVRRRARRWVREAVWALAAALVSVLAAMIALGASPGTLSERWRVGGDDQILHYMLFRSATQSFPFAENGALGFPDGFNAFFTAQFDLASALVAGVLALVIRDGFLLLNVFYLLTFAFVAVTGYAFFRCLRVPPWTAALVATVFSLAPYHFLRISAGHAFLANYWAIPLLGILVLVVAGERTDPFRAWRSRGATPRARLLRGAVPVVLLPAMIATTGGYYYVFTVIVLGGVWLLGALAGLASRVPVRAILARVLPLGVLGVLVAAELVLLGGDWGERYAPYFESRGVGESEDFAGKILSLFLPWQGTEVPKIGALPNIYENATAVAVNTEPPGMSLIAIVGLCLLLASLPMLGLVGGRALRTTAFGRFVSDEHVRVLAVALLWTLLFYVVTGFGMAVALIAGTTIRAWSRLSIVIALLALGAVAIGLARIGRRWVRFAVIALLVVVGVLDQLAGVARMVPIAPTEDEEMTSFVAEADAALPDGCGVVQLPIKSFPDSGAIGEMADYDEALPYLYTEGDHLSWSYGSIRGTTGYDVFGGVGTPEEFAAAVEESGACAVFVDTAAYVDSEGAWYDDVVAVSGSLTPVAQSSSGRWLVFSVVP
ncbi:hypothetical protein SAMN06295885_0844 [Rathayibacter oskolensis]|uniref:4-amino-4-deoxy-L-arabinose transferase n=1 Tax=Rathayibacter oskolensis TaxID=1891671 RepID=A0A1X7N737_9MICO|nr:hypothetical protein [Rathayibacter oskolensis]SMH33311.1 hypothetical protein SAMN06295885_0844 [Rathayibacter oskolensis]